MPADEATAEVISPLSTSAAILFDAPLILNEPVFCWFSNFILYQYSYIRADALTSNLIRYENGQVLDNVINNIWQNPYASNYTLGFSPQDSILLGSVIHYSFPVNLWLSNITPSSIEFDADDGKGYVSVSVGGNLSVSYGSSGVNPRR